MQKKNNYNHNGGQNSYKRMHVDQAKFVALENKSYMVDKVQVDH